MQEDAVRLLHQTLQDSSGSEDFASQSLVAAAAEVGVALQPG